MHWSLKLILDLPKAILEFRRNHIKAARLHKIEKKHGSIAGYKAMLKDPEFSHAEVDIYMDMLPEILECKDDYSPLELEWFLTKGEEYGVLKRVEDIPVEPDESWRKWEEE
tara:strand:- start:95 stop:427 length:333 start_codon:yes stop_codon:yes gene_type:complete